jgi:ribosomal protein S18 acetylase RimI-like enzyme
VISIAEPTVDDIPAIEALLRQLVAAMDDTEGVDPRTVAENVRVLMDDPQAHFLLAKAGDEALGFINFTTRRTALHVGPSGLIDELVVAADHRGIGIGKMLVSAAIETCRRLGCCEVEVSTEMSNTQAREFYKRCGFDEDAVLLEMQLD